MQSWMKNTLLYSRAIGLDQPRTRPASGKTLREGHQFDFLESLPAHLPEVQVCETEVHHQARRAACRVVVASKQCGERGDVRSSFEAVEIVGMLAKPQSTGAQLFIALCVTHPDASPAVALQDYERLWECKVVTCGSATKQVTGKLHQRNSPSRIYFSWQFKWGKTFLS